jgi:hypothetical protein
MNLSCVHLLCKGLVVGRVCHFKKTALCFAYYGNNDSNSFNGIS